jgi:hypothetical protein
MANLSITLNFTSDENEHFEVFVRGDGSVMIADHNVSITGNGALITISREDWAEIVKYVKREHKNI